MMRRAVAPLIVAVLLLGAWAAAQRGERQAARPATSGRTIDDYSLVMQRNIFSPSRRPQRTTDNTRETPPPPPLHTVSLVGTWITPKQRIAFIESNRSEYSGPRYPGTLVDVWTVEDITTTGVLLAHNEQRMHLPVGQRIERRGEEQWRLAGAAVTTATTGTTTAAPAAGTGSSGAGAAEILQRLRERRQTEAQ